MRVIQYIFCVALLTLCISNIDAQEMEVWQPNYTTFTDYTPTITQELLDQSTPADATHPEFGLLPEDAPCDDCYELIHERTTNSRTFVQIGTNGNSIYKQTAYGDLHYTDASGNLVSFDRRLRQTADNVYEALHQFTPTRLDVNAANSAFLVDGQAFVFNNELKLIHIHADGTKENIAIADWSDRTIGDHGIYVHNVWPGIDMQIVYDLNMIKSSYIIKEKPLFTDGYLCISDQLVLPEDFEVGYSDGWMGEKGWIGTLVAASITEETYGFEIGRALAMDNATILDRDSIGVHHYSPEYYLDDATKKLNILVAADWLQNDTLVYPVTIDPLVSSSATYASQMKFRYNGEWCGGVNYCDYYLTVALPTNCTVTAATFSSQYITVTGTCAGSCFLYDAGFRMWTDSCATFSPTPPSFWTCLYLGPGTCTATNFDLSSLFTCLTPKCSGDIVVQMRTSYCYCNTNGTNCATAGLPCQRMNANSWSVTVYGHNLETLGNTATGNGSVSYNDTYCCQDFVLDPAAQYGVPPYTYLWSTGPTTPTITVNNCSNGTYIYTCDVTDACNVTRTATFTILVDDCLLPITLTNFSGAYSNGQVALDWTTESEINNDYFVVERNTNGIFTTIGIVQGQGQSDMEHSYQVFDETPLAGINYYRLRQVDLNGASTYSNTISVVAGNQAKSPYPNPASTNIFFIADQWQNGDEVTVEITSNTGKLIFREKILYTGSGTIHIPISDLSNGTYVATLVVQGRAPLHYSFVKE